MSRNKGVFPLIVVRKHIGDGEWKNYKVEVTDVELQIRKNSAVDYELRQEWDYEPVEHEPLTCITFGCGSSLTLRESLFGNKCSRCQK